MCFHNCVPSALCFTLTVELLERIKRLIIGKCYAQHSRIWKTKVGGPGIQGQQVPGWPKLQGTLSQEILSSPLPKSHVYSGLTNIFKTFFLIMIGIVRQINLTSHGLQLGVTGMSPVRYLEHR